MGVFKLALSGKMRAGKDVAASYVEDSLFHDGFALRKLAFADPIKEILAFAQTVAGFTQERDREFFQWVGTNWGRGRDNNVWVKAMERKIADPEFEDCCTVVTDVRFPNEFNMLREQGFLMVHVQAEDGVRLSRGADPERLLHESETALDALGAFDLILNNNYSFEYFYNKLERLLMPALWRSTAH